MARLDTPPTPSLPLVRATAEPTFVLGGQPYIVDQNELAKAGPELAEMAYFETYRHLWSLWAEYHAGRLPRGEWETRHTELLSGMFHLRDLIPTPDVLIPNGHWLHRN